MQESLEVVRCRGLLNRRRIGSPLQRYGTVSHKLHPAQIRAQGQATRVLYPAQPLHHQPGDQTEHVVPVQRERVVPAVASRPAEDRAVDRTLLRRRARPAQGRPASGRGAQAVQAVGRQVVVVLWDVGYAV